MKALHAFQHSDMTKKKREEKKKTTQKAMQNKHEAREKANDAKQRDASEADMYIM